MTSKTPQYKFFDEKILINDKSITCFKSLSKLQAFKCFISLKVYQYSKHATQVQNRARRFLEMIRD